MPGLSITPAEELHSNETVARGATERRFYPRVNPTLFIPITVAGSAAKLLDVSENGLSIATETGVVLNAVSRISISLHGLAKPIEVTARVVWAGGAENRAGIQLLNLSEEDREQIRKWQTQEATTSNKNSVPAIAPAPAARWIEKDEFLAGLAARSVAIENCAVNNVDHRSEKAAASMEDPHPNPDSSETLENVPTGATSNPLTVVAVVALILTLCFGAGAFILNSWLKSSIQVHQAQNKQTRVPLSHRPAAPPDIGGILQVPSSLTAPKANNQTAADFPAAVTTPDSFRAHAPGTESRRGWTNAPDDSKNSAVSKRPNSVKDAASVGEVQGKPVVSRPTNLPERNQGANPLTNSHGTTDSRDATPPQSTSNAAPLLQAAGASAASSSPAPGFAKSPREMGDAISGSDRADSISASKGAKENVPSAIFPSVSGSSSNATSAPILLEHRESRLTIPKNNSSPILPVNGERVLESPAGRIRIQRSIFVPGEHKWWWPLGKKREKEVLLGELVSRIDPQPPRPVRDAQRVRVRAIVDKNGSVVDLKPVSGAVELMPAVMRAVRQWHYRPTYIDGMRVETEAYISFEFRPSTHIAWR